jgi:hypothetical protein
MCFYLFKNKSQKSIKTPYIIEDSNLKINELNIPAIAVVNCSDIKTDISNNSKINELVISSILQVPKEILEIKINKLPPLPESSDSE